MKLQAYSSALTPSPEAAYALASYSNRYSCVCTSAAAAMRAVSLTLTGTAHASLSRATYGCRVVFETHPDFRVFLNLC